jgi:LuxR family transcriptional regulator, quorum-sensing system regulator BjaR1
MALSLDQTYDVIGKLTRAVTAQDICDGLTSFTGRYGLTSMITASLPAPHEHKAKAQRRHLFVAAFPPGWMDRYLAQDYAHIDPVVSRCKHDLSPFLWAESAPFARPENSAAAGRMFGEACEFNLKAGFVVPTITLDGHIVALSLGGEAAEVPPAARGMISLIGAFAIGRAIELRDRERRRKRAKLTLREAECLKWAAEGKTEWEIGEILRISQHTADKHLSNARRKLGAANRAQAVANAIRWGLIF